MTKREKAQRRYETATARYLALVQMTRPFSRTAAQQAEIDSAFCEIELARDWLIYAKREERNHVQP